MLHAGQRIGPLRIERMLGTGGMGEVYLARDDRLERHVAVKLLPSDRSLDPDARGRMLREARAASALKHPSIVTVHDVGDHDGRVYIVMEYVEGDTLDLLIRKRGRLSAAEAVELIAQAAGALAAAHAAGVLHRDIKGANLMLDSHGRLKVLDFGLSKRTLTTGAPSRPPPQGVVIGIGTGREEVDAIAPTLAPISEGSTEPMTRATVETEAPGIVATGSDEPQTRHGARMGTLGWAPPELIDGRPADVRSDVFSLGAVLYYLLTGKLPFPATDWAAFRDQIERGPIAPSTIVPELPIALDEVVLAALAADPDRRPAGPAELVANARAAIASRRRRGLLPIAAATGAIAIAVVIAVAVAGGGGHRQAAQPTTPVAAPATPDAAPAAKPPPPVRLTHLGGCAYSPAFLDDNRVIFDLTRHAAVDLYQLDLPAGDPVQITSAPGWEWRSWRGASAHEVLYISQSKVSETIRFDLDTRTATPLPHGGGPAVFSGDSYFFSPARSAQLHRLRGQRDEVLLTIPGGRPIDTIAASPRGDRLAIILFGTEGLPTLCSVEIDRASYDCFDTKVGTARAAFSSTGDALYYSGTSALDRLHLADHRVDTVFRDAEPSGGIAVSASGGAMVYSDCGPREELFSVLDSEATPAVDELRAHTPQFGPGGLLAYVRTVPGSREVALVRQPDGATMEVVAHPDQRITDLAFSPDGQSLAYVLGSATAPGVYVIQIGGTEPNRVTEDPADARPQFIPGGLVFTRRAADGTPHMMRVAADGGAVTVASTRPRVVVAADLAHHRILLSSPAKDFLYWWDPATGRETPGPRIPAQFLEVSVSPDGSWVLFLGDNAGRDVWRIHLDGAAKPERAYHLKDDQSSTSAAIDDRGHPMVAVDNWSGDLWLARAADGAPW